MNLNCDTIVGKNLMFPQQKANVLKYFLYKNNIDLKSFFQDFDKLKKKKITINRFKAFLNQFQLKLQENDLQKICEQYQIDQEYINYYKFCEEMEEIKSNEQQKNNLQQSCQNKVLFNDKEQVLLEEALNYLSQQVHIKRIHLKSNFKDFDISNRGVISKFQFQRTLHKLLNLQIPDNHIKVVIRKYLTDGNEKEFNYLKFIKDIDQRINLKINKENIRNFNVSETVQKQNNHFQIELNLDDILRKIKRECHLKNKDIKLFFQDFDKLRKNVCESSKLKFCLSALDIHLNEAQIDYLTQYYVQFENSAKLFNYKNFLNDLQKVELVIVQFNDSLLNGLQSYIEQAQKIQNQRNFYLKQKFQDFDINNEGTVTQQQFKRVLSFFELLPEDNLLIQKLLNYLNYNGRVKYHKFLSLLQQKQSNKNITRTYTPIFQDNSEPVILEQDEIQNVLEDVFQQMRQQEDIKKLDYKFYLKTNDNLNNGKIDDSKFISFLNIAGFNLNKNQRAVLIQNYSYLNRVNYKDFLQDYECYCSTNQNIITIKSTMDNEAKQILDDLKEFCKVNRIYLKQFFKNFDKFNRLKIKKPKFEQVLHCIGYYLDQQKLNQFYKYITDPVDNQLIDYKKILDHLQQQKKMYTSQINIKQNTLKNMNSQQVKKQNFPYQQLLEKIQTQRIELKQYFQDFDPLNKKLIRKEQFIGVLDKLVSISKIQGYESIQEQYQVDDEFVNYENFINDLEKNQLKQQNCKKRQVKYDKLTSVETIRTNIKDDNEIQQLENILKEIAFVNKKAQIFWQLYFKEIDKLNKGYVSKTKVRSLLDRLGMQFTNEGFDLLLKSFQKNIRDFDYLSFIDSISIYENNQIIQTLLTINEKVIDQLSKINNLYNQQSQPLKTNEYYRQIRTRYVILRD